MHLKTLYTHINLVIYPKSMFYKLDRFVIVVIVDSYVEYFQKQVQPAIIVKGYVRRRCLEEV